MATQRNVAQEIAPKMAELSANVLFGDVWERPELSKRDRSLIQLQRLQPYTEPINCVVILVVR